MIEFNLILLNSHQIPVELPEGYTLHTAHVYRWMYAIMHLFSMHDYVFSIMD